MSIKCLELKRHKLILIFSLSLLGFVLSPFSASAGANFTEFSLPDPTHSIETTTTGNNGDIWFSTWYGNDEEENHGLGKISAEGEIEEFSVTAQIDSDCGNITSIAVLPNNEVWFQCSWQHETIYKRAVNGDITRYNPNSSVENIDKLVVGPDGDIWYIGSQSYIFGPGSVQYGSSYLVKLSNAGEVLSEYDLQTNTADDNKMVGFTSDLKVGPDGNFWVSLSNISYLARITPSGIVSKFEVGGYSGRGPYKFSLGSNNKFWMTFNESETAPHSASVASMDMAGNLQIISSGQIDVSDTDGSVIEDKNGNLIIGAHVSEGVFSPVIVQMAKDGQIIERFPAPLMAGDSEARMRAIGWAFKGSDDEVWYIYRSYDNTQNATLPFLNAFFRVIVTPDDNGTPPLPEQPNANTPSAPRTGRLLGAVLITTTILSGTLLLARACQRKLHESSSTK